MPREGVWKSWKLGPEVPQPPEGTPGSAVLEAFAASYWTTNCMASQEFPNASTPSTDDDIVSATTKMFFMGKDWGPCCDG